MKRIVIIGAGGHGKEVADIARHQAQAGAGFEAIGFIDDSPDLRGQIICGLPVLGDWAWFDGADRRDIAVVCAIGSPRICRLLVERARAHGLDFASVISPLAHISSFARLGEGVTAFPNTVINAGAFVDSYCILNVSATVSHDTQIGRYCNINPGAHLAGNVKIGDGCYIGMGASIIQGLSIGAWSVVGAGAAVIGDVPGGVTAVGVPAKIIERREQLQ